MVSDAEPAGPAAAAERGCEFLRARQLPSGEIPINVSADHERAGAWTPDPTVFASSVVALNLVGVPGESAATIRHAAADFIDAQRTPPGLWRFWSAEHPLAKIIPFDADDTACAAMAVGDEAGAATARALLANRSPDGLFFTWFVRHRGRFPLEPAFWRAAASGLRRPLHRRQFWRQTEAEPSDIDAVVCANVLALLGDRDETAATSSYLIAIVRERREAEADKWYHRPLALHLAIAAAAARGTRSLSAIRDQAVARILEQRSAGGQIGDDVLDSALACCALADWAYNGPELSAALGFLQAQQLPDGSWPASAYYTGGPKRITRWGSAELTTSFCVRALAQGRRRPQTKLEA